MTYFNDKQRYLIEALANAVAKKTRTSVAPFKPNVREHRPTRLQGITREQHEAMRTHNPGYWTAGGLRYATFVRIDFFNGRPVAFYRLSWIDNRNGTRWCRDIRWGFKGGVLREEKQYPERLL